MKWVFFQIFSRSKMVIEIILLASFRCIIFKSCQFPSLHVWKIIQIIQIALFPVFQSKQDEHDQPDDSVSRGPAELVHQSGVLQTGSGQRHPISASHQWHQLHLSKVEVFGLKMPFIKAISNIRLAKVSHLKQPAVWRHRKLVYILLCCFI